MAENVPKAKNLYELWQDQISKWLKLKMSETVTSKHYNTYIL